MKVRLKMCMGNDAHTTHETHEMHHEKKGMDRVAHTFEHIAAMPPETWAKYEKGSWDTVHMEFVDAQNAHAAMKAGTGTYKDFIKELGHLGAAIMCAYEKMTCDK